MKVVTTRGPAETRRLAARLGKLLAPGDVLSLSGGLGAGKTCFVQGLARGLGVPAGTRIASPTFNIVLEYDGRAPLVHIDLYRVAEEGELDEIGLDHYLYGHAVVAVEWLERFPSRAPAHRLDVRLEITGAKDRRITACGHGSRGTAIEEAWP